MTLVARRNFREMDAFDYLSLISSTAAVTRRQGEGVAIAPAETPYVLGTRPPNATTATTKTTAEALYS
jgi:hypothetical protein